ncbi:MAG: hypothetical protein EZS28_023515 [Streblomastix strix]|uniref:Right handed beta helix domain-containing protein n=1 Tax=Streblomastix strix TaxID=222440 RepID=A0A5J4VEW1_9EUKA|nr:MAG: hypothetical protein EZS28_023515 [Streblomastix strix]
MPAFLLIVIVAVESQSSFASSTVFPSSYDTTSGSKIANEVCIWKVSQQYSGIKVNKKTAKTVRSAVDQACADSIEIILEDISHSEHLFLNKTQENPVLIKNGAKDGSGNMVRTAWHTTASNTSFGMFIYQAVVTLQNIEFSHTLFANGTIWPTMYLIVIQGSQGRNNSVTIISCIFNGLGSSYHLYRMIGAYNVDNFVMRNSLIQNAVLDRMMDISSSSQNKIDGQVFIERCKFRNISTDAAPGAIQLIIGGIDKIAWIWSNEFTNISNSYNNSLGNSGAIYISTQDRIQLSISNNTFINCHGQDVGAVYSRMFTNSWSFNQNYFAGNSKNGSDQRGCDIYLLWPGQYNESISDEDARLNVLYKFNFDYSTQRNSIFFNITGQQQLSYRWVGGYIDLSEQNNTYCICLETGDPRAGQGQCPAYCVKGQVEEDCTCDSNITGYSVQQCQIEKSCKYDLYHQTKADCPCLQADYPMRDSVCKQQEVKIEDNIGQNLAQKEESSSTIIKIITKAVVARIVIVIVIVSFPFVIIRSRNKKKHIENELAKVKAQFNDKEKALEEEKRLNQTQSSYTSLS